MQRFFLIFIIAALVVIIIIPLILIILGIQSSPLVNPVRKLDFDDVARVKQLMKDNDPRKLQRGDIKNIIITERDLNLLLNYSFAQAPGERKLAVQADLQKDLAIFYGSYSLPANPFGGYLNVSATLSAAANQIDIQQMKIGDLSIPRWLARPLAKLGHGMLMRFHLYRNSIEVYRAINAITIFDGSVLIVYQWQPDVIKKLQAQGRDFLLTADEKERFIAYSHRVAAITREYDGKQVSLIHCLQPLFQLAEQRSVKQAEAEAEHRALIIAAAAYCVGRNVGKYLGIDKAMPQLRFGRARFTLAGRTDHARHFLVSAAIAVSGGTGLANLAGIFKEMDDSQGGSGFSFADLAADRAGVRFGELAIASSSQAKLLQQQMATMRSESDFMPSVENLPEGIQELEFKKAYHDLDSMTYKMTEAEIERRIRQCRIYASGE